MSDRMLEDRARRASATADHVGRGALLAALVLVLALALAGCAGAAETAPMHFDRADMVGLPSEAAAPEAVVSRSAGSPVDRAAVTTVAATDRPATARLRVYSGRLELSVARVEQARRAIIDHVTRLGGYVERSQSDQLVVRVPAARFFEAMARIEAEGAIESRAVETADVTEQYADLERRIVIATASRERLYELLERSDDAEERVAVLREIRRLTEEIEQLASSLESLSQLVEYSRITVTLGARIQANQVMRDEIPFPWIARLDPLRQTAGIAGRELRYALPDSFAAFEQGRRIRAEASDGSRVRLGALMNRPAGDTAFWSEALRFHLGPFYRSAEAVAVGSFSGALFESRDHDPFSYLVLAAIRDDELLVVEGFFPDAAARDRHLPAIVSMLEGGGQ